MATIDQHDILLEELEAAVAAKDESKVRNLYERLQPLVELDFWCETFYESSDWEIIIAADVRRKNRNSDGNSCLTIWHLTLIKNIALFEELLKSEVNMDDVDGCIEELQYEVDENPNSDLSILNKKKIALIQNKLKSLQIEQFVNNPDNMM